MHARSIESLISAVYADIGTQFNGVIGLSDMLASNMDTLSNEDNKELLQLLSSNLRDTYSVYHNLLIALLLNNTTESGTDKPNSAFPFAFFYLSEIIALVEKAFSIHIEYENTKLHCNKRLITQLISNFISLSGKLSPNANMSLTTDGKELILDLSDAEVIAELIEDYQKNENNQKNESAFLHNYLISKDLSDKISILASMKILKYHSAEYKIVRENQTHIEMRFPLGEGNQIRIF